MLIFLFPNRIDALLLLYYKKNLKVKKNTKEMEFQINRLLPFFGPPPFT
jgi:hypothetical protein